MITMMSTFQSNVILQLNATKIPQTQVAFKNCVPFTKCITKIDGITRDDIEELDSVMAMYTIIEYKDETTNSNAAIIIISNLSNIRLNYQETHLLRLILLLMEF